MEQDLTVFESFKTIRDIFVSAVERAPERTAIRWKARGEWHSITYGDYMKRVRRVSEVAGALKLRPGDRAALMMENRPSWMITYLGLSCCGIEVVPIDAKLHEGEVAHILRDSGSKAVFAGGKMWPLLQEIESGLPNLESIALLDGVIDDSFKDSGVRHYDLDKLLEKADEDAQSDRAYFMKHKPEPESVASIVYTSGTTGRPKGAMLMHSNFVAQVVGAMQCVKVYPEDSFLLVLPLHHAFAFTASFIVPVACLCEIDIVENLRTVAENMREVSPSVLLAVPLLAEKMLNAIMRKLEKNMIAKVAMKIGLSRAIGKKIIASLGGRMRIIICGGAASDPDMLRTLNSFGIRTFEGFGLTETSPICALNPEDAIKYGSVGKALPGNEIKIDEPNAEGIGEIMVKGPVIMKGYFRNEAATAECYDGEWLRTGDLGKMDDEGYVTITGRKKSLIVNREGKNIYPEEVEIAINSAPHILESVVLGYSTENEKGEKVGAIIVPDMDQIAASRRGSGDPLSDEEIVKLVTNEARKACMAISEYKRPRKLQVRFEPLERTTTQKVKRYLYSL